MKADDKEEKKNNYICPIIDAIFCVWKCNSYYGTQVRILQDVRF